MKSKIFSSDFVKAVSKGNMWIPAFLTLGFLLAFPIVNVLILGNWRGAEYTPGQIEILYENLWRDGFLITGGIVTAAAAFLNGIRGFLYLYSREQTDFYHSLPVKRSSMFWGRVYVGLLYFLIPYAFMEFLAVCIGAAQGFFSLRLMGMALKLLAIHFLLYLLLYFSVVLAECLTGNLLTGALFLAGMNLYGLILSILLICCGRTFYDTFFTEKVYGIFAFLQKYVSPAFLAESFLKAYKEATPSSWLTAAVTAVTAVLAVCSWQAYIRRPSESAGKPVTYRWVEKIVKFLIVIPCGLGTGFIFYVLPASGTRTFWWIFGLILGTVLSHGLIEVLYRMDFRGFFSARAELLAAAMLAAGVGIVYQRDLTNFDKYIPKQNEIAEIAIDTQVLSGEYGNKVEKLEDGSYRVDNISGWQSGGMELSADQGIGEDTYSILQDIVDRQADRSTTDKPDSTDMDCSYLVGIMYRMRSGRAVYRNYYIRSDEIRELISCFYEEENMKNQMFSFLELDSRYLSDLSVICADSSSYNLFQNENEQREKFLQALASDIREAEGESMVQIPCARLNLSYRLPAPETPDQMIPGREMTTNEAFWSVNIFPSYKRTLAFLEETGYPLSVNELDIKKISVNYYDEEGREESVDYESSQEIEALKNGMVPAFLTCSWLDYAEGADAYIYLSNNLASGNYMYLLEDRLPDFVKDHLREKEKTGQNEEEI